MDKAKKRIGVHVGTAGGTWTAVERAVAAGANTFQIFSSSPRQWRAAAVKPEDAAKMRDLRAKHDVGPVSVHASYLINLCSQTESVRVNGVAAFRGEVERALALGAEYLVLHPGSWKGLTREEGLRLAAESIERAIDGVGGAGRAAEAVCAGGGVPGYVPCACGRVRPGFAGWLYRDDDGGGRYGGVRHGEGLALQRCEGGNEFKAGPA
jgi:endonuclease IV